MPVTLAKTKTPPIYLLTCMHYGQLEPGKHVIRRQRTWGWFPSESLAVQAVCSNDADMFEMGYYNMAVIEEVRWGTLARVSKEVWLKADYLGEEAQDRKYIVAVIEKPEPLRFGTNFGIG